jgi:sugar (pentulose or hexulose) kinase
MSAPLRHVGVLDIGKTNVKVAVVDLPTRTEIAVLTRPNIVLPGPPWPHFDTEGHWTFFLDALAELHKAHGIDALAVTTHGACAALLAADGTLAAPVLDYEHEAPEAMREAFHAIRPPFSETGTPALRMGLSVGAQLFWQFAEVPGLRERTAHILFWPQYWAWRLSGGIAADLTSLGCHTDLWNPRAGRFSSLVDRLGIRDRIAPAQAPGAILGTVRPDVAARTGLPPETPVTAGIHDSNASLVPHLTDRAAPFGVVSTGTWVVVMAVGGRAVRLDPARDTLVNVNAMGECVNSARFMGGREYEIVREGRPPVAGAADAARVLDEELMLLPSVLPVGGPFPGRAMAWHPADPAEDALREVALGYYLALMTTECLEISGALGPVIVEGPFARNPFFLDMLAAATGRPVIPSSSATGTAIGAALLLDPQPRTPSAQAHPAPSDPALAAYAREWRARAGG